MTLAYWFRALFTHKPSLGRARRPEAPKRVRLAVEALEDRVFLNSASISGGTGCSNDWVGDSKDFNTSADTVSAAQPGPVTETLITQAPAPLINASISTQASATTEYFPPQNGLEGGKCTFTLQTSVSGRVTGGAGNDVVYTISITPASTTRVFQLSYGVS